MFAKFDSEARGGAVADTKNKKILPILQGVAAAAILMFLLRDLGYPVITVLFGLLGGCGAYLISLMRK